MKRFFSHALSYVKKTPKSYFFLGALGLTAIWFFFFRGDSEATQTLLIEPKPFVQAVSVSGKVIAAQEVDLGFSQGGRVTSVYARVGARVGAGATLAVTENGDLRAALLQRQAALERERAKLSSLEAGTRPEEIAVAEADVDSGIRALIDDIQDAYRAADGAVHTSMDQFISNPRTAPTINFGVNDSSLKSSVEQRRGTVELTLAEWGRDVSSLMPSSDLAAAVAKSQQVLSIVTALLSDTSSAISRGIPNASVSQSSLDTYAADIGTARTNVNAAAAAITTSSATLESARRTLALKKAGTTPQDIQAQAAVIKAAEADVAAAQAQLNKTYITAPFAGTVTTVDAKVGKIVSPNTPEISMISTGAFQVESFVPEVNIALLAVGDSAAVTLDAYGEEELFAAKVVSIDPAETVRDGVSTYRALLQFNTQDSRIKSGMTANVQITTEEKQNVLAVPQGIVKTRDGKKFVTVLVGKERTERQVMLGSVSSLGEVEILSGLQAGDVVVLTL